jgi:hypothetical protein
MTDTPLVYLSAAEAATARANGKMVYSVTTIDEYSTTDWNTAPPPPVATSLGFGVNGAGLCWPSSPSNTVAFNNIKSLGATYVRTSIPWNYSQGRWTSLYLSDGKTFDPNAFATINTFVSEAKSCGLTPLFVVDGCIAPAGAYPTNPQYNAGYPITPQDFATAMGELVKNCPGLHLEIINEPDYYTYGSGAQTQLTPSVYVEALKMSYPVMKAADKTCTVHLGPVANINLGGGGYNWLAAVYALGAVGFYDVFSFHLYPWRGNRTWETSDTGPLDTQITGNLAALRAKFNDTSPMWLTETGWQSVTTNSGDTSPEMTPALQSQYLVSFLDRLKQLYPKPDVVVVYCLQDYNGANGAWGLIDIDEVTLKPSFTAVQTLIKG